MTETSYQDVQRISESGDFRRIPIKREMLSDIRTPIETLMALQNESDHCFILESAEDSRQWGRYTFLGFDPEMEIRCRDGEMYVTEGNETKKCHTDHPGEFIKNVVSLNKSPALEGFPTFTGGLVGYFSYEYMQYGEPAIKFNNPGNFDDCDLMLFDKLICYDNLYQKIILIANVKADDTSADSLKEAYKRALSDLDRMDDIIRHGKKAAHVRGHLKSELKPHLDRKEFSEKVERIKHHIIEGDIFQLVFSNPMEAEFEGSLLDTYRILRTTNPSPYMFYFSGDMEIAGASPETLVKVTGRSVKTFPLAGTRKRGADAEEDARLERELLANEKERAEHNMLVDLGRNDIGRLCRFGSVHVDRYMNVLRFSHVMHIGSEVEGTLRDDVSAVDAIDTVLPAGTLSGAPKVRACQIIEELEDSRRGLYGGAIGYVDFTGNLDVCIGIRLAFAKDNTVYVRSGAGIVADSIPENEYQECVNKAAAVVQAIREADNDTSY
jgi:anthranilate synthase component 1